MVNSITYVKISHCLSALTFDNEEFLQIPGQCGCARLLILRLPYRRGMQNTPGFISKNSLSEVLLSLVPFPVTCSVSALMTSPVCGFAQAALTSPMCVPSVGAWVGVELWRAPECCLGCSCFISSSVLPLDWVSTPSPSLLHKETEAPKDERNLPRPTWLASIHQASYPGLWIPNIHSVHTLHKCSLKLILTQ